MNNRRVSIVGLVIAWTLVVLTTAILARASNDADLEAQLRTTYLKKEFIIRGFYTDDHIVLDSNSQVKGKPQAGAWTNAGIYVKSIQVSANRIELDGDRFAELYDLKQARFLPVKTGHSWHIVVIRDASQEASRILNSLSLVFLKGTDLVNLIPEYWKPWICGSLEAVPQEKGRDCYEIKGELVRSDGGNVVRPCDEHAEAKLGVSNSPVDVSSLPFRVGGDVIAFKPIHAPDPEYPDLARENHIEGTVFLRATVTTNGDVADVAVIGPFGFGLDDQGVATVKKWRFHPATLHGKPVPARTMIEVSFKFH